MSDDIENCWYEVDWEYDSVETEDYQWQEVEQLSNPRLGPFGYADLSIRRGFFSFGVLSLLMQEGQAAVRKKRGPGPPVLRSSLIKEIFRDLLKFTLDFGR